MCKDKYVIEINSQEYLDSNGNGTNSKFYLDLQGRFPGLVGKTVVVKPNFYQLTNVDVRPDVFMGYSNVFGTDSNADGSIDEIETIFQTFPTAGYTIRSNLYNEKSFSKSGSSSTILMPMSFRADSFHDYSFEAVLPSQLEVYITVFNSPSDPGQEALLSIKNDERFIVSFTIMEKDTE